MSDPEVIYTAHIELVTHCGDEECVGGWRPDWNMDEYPPQPCWKCRRETLFPTPSWLDITEDEARAYFTRRHA